MSRDTTSVVMLDGAARASQDAHLGEGTRADGERADGERAEGERADGERAEGERADGERADGDRVSAAEVRPAERVEAALRANAPDLLGYLLRRTERDDAPEVLSDVFLVAWRRRDALPEDPLRARMWLFGVARRSLANHRRSRGRASVLTERLRQALAESTATAETLVPGSEAGERAREVREAVRALPPRQRELVALVHWDGFSLTDAAEILGVRASTARSHYARARERLTAVLGTS